MIYTTAAASARKPGTRRPRVSVMIRGQRLKLKLVVDTPPARDAACEEQSPVHIGYVGNDTADPHDAILGLNADVIGKDVRVILQRLHHLRSECFILLPTGGDDDFLQGRIIAALNANRLRHGGRPGSQNSYS
jgi:hypothetical protein